MPTIRPRHMITETDDVARALDAAARLWPDERDDRAALLRRLIAQGAKSVDAVAADRSARRRAAIRETSGIVRGLYPPGEAKRLRDEWPE